MKFELIYQILAILYRQVLRQALVVAINDPDSETDDFILALVDNLLGYKEQ